MSEIRGVVESITSSPGRGRAQGKTFWNVIVAGETYSCGTRPPEVKVGSLVAFDVKIDRGFKSAWDIRLDGGEASAQRTAGPAAGSVPSLAGDSTLLAAAAIVCTFARITEPGWGIADYIAQVRDVAARLR